MQSYPGFGTLCHLETLCVQFGEQFGNYFTQKAAIKLKKQNSERWERDAAPGPQHTDKQSQRKHEEIAQQTKKNLIQIGLVATTDTRREHKRPDTDHAVHRTHHRRDSNPRSHGSTALRLSPSSPAPLVPPAPSRPTESASAPLRRILPRRRTSNGTIIPR